MKRYLVTMIALLVAALGAGIAVWFFYQDLNATALIEDAYIEEPMQIEETSTPTATPEVVSDGSTQESVPSEPVTITAESLTENQRKMLEAFGFDQSEYTITEAMIECARGKVGGERLSEVLNGAAPSPLEAMSLIPCMKQ